jgi:hypothetical protein
LARRRPMVEPGSNARPAATATRASSIRPRCAGRGKKEMRDRVIAIDFDRPSQPDNGFLVLAHIELLRPTFFDFSHCRLFPLEYRLPARFETIPSRPSLQALAKTSAPSATKASLNRMQSTPGTSGQSAARRSSIGR